jgi:uncharacterized repeat protein (TIGR03803 family)
MIMKAALRICLVLFAVSLVSAQGQTFLKLHDFGSPGDGAYPLGLIAQGRDGNLYSTTAQSYKKDGTIFQLTPAGALTVMHVFQGKYASRPEGGLTLGRDGNLYGTTGFGGKPGAGTFFKLTQKGHFIKVMNFPRNEYRPSMLTLGNAGNFFGLTQFGGDRDQGTIYKVNRDATLTTLHRFNGQDGKYPYSALVQANDGHLYGVTATGGSHGQGTVFRIAPNHFPQKYTVLHEFKGSDGSAPSSLVLGENGVLYGTASEVIFKISPSGDFKVLHVFQGDEGSANGLTLGSDGNFYGGTHTTLYRITPKGEMTVLYRLAVIDGLAPNPLVQHTNGVFYGTATEGGENFSGSVFSLDVGLPPFVAPVVSGAFLGKTVGVLGQGLAGATSVTFDGTPATFEVLSDTYLEAVVPSAARTGRITVTTLTDVLNSKAAFWILPEIVSLEPSGGHSGTPVTIHGSGLSQTRHVFFSQLQASFSVVSDTEVTTIVPDGVAGCPWIRVKTPGGIARSSAPFCTF